MGCASVEPKMKRIVSSLILIFSTVFFLESISSCSNVISKLARKSQLSVFCSGHKKLVKAVFLWIASLGWGSRQGCLLNTLSGLRLLVSWQRYSFMKAAEDHTSEYIESFFAVYKENLMNCKMRAIQLALHCLCTSFALCYWNTVHHMCNAYWC